MAAGEVLVGVHEDDHQILVERLEDGAVDQSSFAMPLQQTFIGESRIDDLALAYEASLTPEAVIAKRRMQREARKAVKIEVVGGTASTAKETAASPFEASPAAA